jgi:hypothetical protein
MSVSLLSTLPLLSVLWPLPKSHCDIALGYTFLIAGSVGKSPRQPLVQQASHQPTVSDAGVRGVVSSYMEEVTPSSLPIPLLRAYHFRNTRDRDVTVIARCQPEARETAG